MTEIGTILKGSQQTIEKLESADIIVAIPTYNNAETIGPIVKAASAGLERFPDRKAIVAQVDGGSADATMQRALEAAGPQASLLQMSYPIYPVHRMLDPETGVPGRDSAYRTIFSLARETGAKACCVIEPDVAEPSPEWIFSLVRPLVEEELDLVAPIYQRHKHEGFLINGVVYPLVRALFGKRLRQAMGSEFGYSPALIRHCLALDSWNTESVRREVELWITVQAIAADMRVGQARLGPRQRARRDGGADLSSILSNVMGALYDNIEQTAEFWQRVRGSHTVPTSGLRFQSDIDPPPVEVRSMIEAFRVGYANLKELWALFLPPATLLELKKMSRHAEAAFRFDDELWARVIYDFAIGHRLGTIGRDHLLRALTPLYMGWTASFLLSMKESRSSEAEERIEQLALAYERQKPYLISRWRWPDRFMP
jgi:hypothetical protein